MSVTAGSGFLAIEGLPNSVESEKRVNREGHLLVMKYTPGDESKVNIRIVLYLHNDDTEYVLTETDANKNIIEWLRVLTAPNAPDEFDTIYPVRLPGRVVKFIVNFEFIGATSEGTIEIQGLADAFVGPQN